MYTKASFIGVLLICAFPFVCYPQESGGAEPLEGLDQYVQKLMDDWSVPGVAVGVIRDGEIILQRGYGYRDVERQLPVTTKTQFAIGSCSKAFTAMAVCMLIDDGRIGLNSPVIDYLPDFRMHDDYATLNTTPADMLMHRTGMPGHTAIFIGSLFSREEVFRRLRHLEPQFPFRERFVYSNLMYVMAGYMVGRLSGGTWEQFVRERIFEPLGMANSNFSVNDMILSDDYATPHQRPFNDCWEGERYAFAPRLRDTSAPAGGINSSVADMLKWVKLHLDDGVVGEERLVSAELLQIMHSPTMGFEYRKSDIHTASGYGMGWNIEIYRGRYVVHHGGIVDGYCAKVCLLPMENAGMVVLTNMKMHSLHDVLSYYIIDRLLGLEPFDFNSRFLLTWRGIDRNIKNGQRRLQEQRVADAPHSLAAADYAGVYEHPGYGRIVVEQSDGVLSAVFNEREAIGLEHYHYDVWMSSHPTLTYFDSLPFKFNLGSDAKVKSLTVPLRGDIEFVRVAGEAEQ